MSLKPMNRTSGDRPTDLELMLYADDELDTNRAAVIEAYLNREASCRTTITALHLASDLVREQALTSAAGADGIADAVMAKIAASAGTSNEEPKPAALHSRLERMASEHIIEAKVLPVLAKPANDNARGIFALTAIAVAAAAGMLLWGRTETQPQNAQIAPVAIESIAKFDVAPVQPSPVKGTEVATPDGEIEHGVEIATVDFGTHIGTIFYVPTGAAPSNMTTTVVWLNDDAVGGK